MFCVSRLFAVLPVVGCCRLRAGTLVATQRCDAARHRPWSPGTSLLCSSGRAGRRATSAWGSTSTSCSSPGEAAAYVFLIVKRTLQWFKKCLFSRLWLHAPTSLMPIPVKYPGANAAYQPSPPHHPDVYFRLAFGEMFPTLPAGINEDALLFFSKQTWICKCHTLSLCAMYSCANFIKRV